MAAVTAEALAPMTGDGYDVVPLVRRLRSQQDRFAAAAQQAVLEQVVAYRENDTPGLRLEVAANCAHVFGIFLDTLASGRAPSSADFPTTAGHAARRVLAGISLEDFLKAFRIGQAVLWDHVRSAADGLPGGSNAALTVVGHLMATIEAASSAAARGYVEAGTLRATDAARVDRDLVEDLLAGRTALAETRTETLAGAGLVPGSRLLVGVGLPRDPEGTAPLLPEAAELLSRAVAQSVGGIVVVRQDEVVAVVPVDVLGEATALSRLTRLTESLAGRGIPVAFGFSTVRAGLGEVPGAYHEAQLALARLGHRAGLLALSSLSTLDYLVTRPDETARQLVRPELRTFIEDDTREGGVLVDTLLKYVAADMNARAAAVHLHVHVNTIYYRIDRISERTGQDLRRLDEVIDLLLAVRLLA
jgi:PucR C-terminal helix-turn-helix domain/GGDEF-like domain